MSMQNDWRLHGQESFLMGVTMVHQPWKPSDPQNDHDHCEFCWARFSRYAADLHVGYSTEDRCRWVCEQCFHDFQRKFSWRVKENA